MGPTLNLALAPLLVCFARIRDLLLTPMFGANSLFNTFATVTTRVLRVYERIHTIMTSGD